MTQQHHFSCFLFDIVTKLEFDFSQVSGAQINFEGNLVSLNLGSNSASLSLNQTQVNPNLNSI